MWSAETWRAEAWAKAVLIGGLEAAAACERAGLRLLMVEQNVRTALKYANRALVLEMGRLALDRPAPELLHDPDLNRLFLGGRAPAATGTNA